MKIVRALAALAVIAVLGAGAWYGYDAVVTQPVRHVVFEGATERLPRPRLEALAQTIEQSTSGVSLATVREAARAIPWVRDAGVRRRFPDTVVIQFTAHEALARWNDNALVSRRGEVFIADYAEALPVFRGPDEAAAAMANEFASIAHTLAPLENPIAELKVSPRGAWQVQLQSGLVLQVGRGDLQARLGRFVSAWPQLAAREDVQYADLRYANGFAVRKAATKTTRAAS